MPKSRLLCLLAGLLLSPRNVPAQTFPVSQSPPIHGIAHIALRVNDIQVSRDFYQRLGYLQSFAFDKNGVVTQSFLKVNDRQFIRTLSPGRGSADGLPAPLLRWG